MEKSNEKASPEIEDSINQRIKFLVTGPLKTNTHKLSKLLGVSDGTLRNYVDSKAKPGAEFLSLMVKRISGLNAEWLLTGIGEPILAHSISTTGESLAVYTKANKGISIGTNHGVAAQHYNTIADCEVALAAAQDKIRLLESQLTDKERIIQLLEMQLKK